MHGHSHIDVYLFVVILRNFGQVKESISEDHKPSEVSEKNRIIKAGGKVY